MHRHRQMHRTCPGAQWYPVPEGECDMRVPQVSERIKEAPAQALRGVFAGIGQLLLVTDKIRNKTSHPDVARARAPRTVTDTTVTSPADRVPEPRRPRLAPLRLPLARLWRPLRPRLPRASQFRPRRARPSRPPP